MKKFFLLFFTLILWAGFNGEVWGQVSITSLGVAKTENFNDIGTSATATLPTGFKIGTDWSSGTTATTVVYGTSGTGIVTGTSPGGTVNWANGVTASSTDRAVGFLTTGSFSSPRSIIFAFTNNTGGTITSLDISWNYEKYRSGSRAFDWTFFHGSTSTASTAATAGDQSYSADANNTVISNPPLSTSKSFTISSLSIANGATYYLRWTYTGSGGNTNAQGLGIDDFSVTGNGIVISSSSDIIANTSFTYPTNIAYGSYQGATLTDVNSVEVAQFDIRDGGGSADADALSTTLTAIGFNVTGHANLRRIALFDGATNIGEVVAGATASFSSLTLAAADGGSKTFSVRVSFLASVTDNQQFSFTVSSATASGAGSGFAAANAGGAATSTTGDNNKIEVTATDIIFDQQVSTVSMGVVMSPSPTLQAVDGNVNRDLDYNAAWSAAVTAGVATFDGGATTSGNFSSGVATLSNLVFDKAGEDNIITVTSGGFSDASAQFNVTDPQPEINIKVVDANYLTNSTYAFGNQLSGTSTSAVTFTIENLGTEDLNLSGSPIVEISGTNSSEFTVDISSTDATIPVSGTTNFTVTFSPTSQGSKTAQLSIANDDGTGDENPYIINLTGTGTVSGSSDISSTGGFSYTSNIAYASFQSASTLTTENSVGVNGLTLRDGGSSADDTDNLGTTLTAISLTTGGSTAIRTAALFDGATNVSEVAVNGGTTITFTGLTLSASDNSTKNFVLRVTFQSNVTDNQQITFTVSSATASSAGSGFAAGNAGAAASSATGDINRIEVTATQLAFVQQPSNTIANSNMTPAVTVKGTDVNTNTDLDFTADINITSTGTLSSTPQTAAAVAGIATFSSINHTATGTSLTLSAASTGLTGATSSTFDITIQPAGNLLFEENFAYTGLLSANGYSALSGTGTNNLTSGATGLVYTNYASSGIGNALAVANTGQDVSRSFSQQNSPNTVYASFLVNISSSFSGGDYVFAFAPSSGATNYRGRFFVKSSSNSGYINFGISNSAAGTYGTTDYLQNTTHLIVVKYQFTSATSATATVFVNPNLTSEPQSSEITVTDIVGANAPADITSFAIRQGSNTAAPTFVIDGIRVATNWGSLMGSPQYNSTTNLGAGNYSDLNVLSGGVVTLTGSANINGTLNLNGGTIDVGNNILTVNSISGGSASSYIKTTGSGGLKRNVPTIESGTLFPIGTESSYNPVTLTNSGTADNFTVSVKETFDNAPVDPTKVVNRQWSISEDTPGGSNAAVKLQWNTAEEAGSFIRTNAIYVGHYTGGSWQQTAATYVDLGSGVYTAEASGFTSFSPFGIGNENALPVELSSFSALPKGNGVQLTWATATEINNFGFNIERKMLNRVQHDNSWEEIGFVKGNGNSNSPKEYSYTDNTLNNSGKYIYRLKQIDNDGAVTYSNEIETDVTVVLEYALSQNYPNPFNPTTKIVYSMPESGLVTLKVYNIVGEEVAELVNSLQDAGKYEVEFNGRGLSNGVFFYELKANGFTSVKKLILLK